MLVILKKLLNYINYNNIVLLILKTIFIFIYNLNISIVVKNIS